MRKSLSVLVLALALLLSGCDKQPAPPTVSPDQPPATVPTVTKQEFVLPYYPNTSLHPITGGNRTNLVLGSLVYQGLFELDNQFAAHGQLCASSSVSEDGLTWTFVLRRAFFSDGTAVTAAHVVDSLNLARTSALYAARLTDVTRISAGADGSVILNLARPNGALPALLDIPVVWDNGAGGVPLGTGPYAFVEDERPLRLVRQSHAPDTAPAEIALCAISGADDLIYAFDAGNAGLVVSDLTGANALGFSSGYEAFDYPTTTMLYVGFHTTQGPCRDVRIRQAISRSFDRDTVTTSLLAGHAKATCLPVSPVCALYSSQHEQNGAYNPTAVDELLTQAGCAVGSDGVLYNGRSPQSLDFIVNTDNSFKLTVADYLAEQLRALGFVVTLHKLSWEDYTSALSAGRFDLYLGEVTLSADFDLTALLATGGRLNYGGYYSADTAAALDQLRRTGEADRPTAAQALWTQLQADTPISPLCFKDHSVLTQWRAVSGLQPTRQNPFYNLENLRFDA